jgi:hypothetical protein
MSLVKWTIWNPVTHRATRSGQVDESLLHLIPVDPATERLLVGEEANLREDEVTEDGGLPALRRRPQAVLDAEQAARVPVDPTEVLAEALKAKGIEVSKADLDAARTKIVGARQARRD